MEPTMPDPRANIEITADVDDLSAGLAEATAVTTLARLRLYLLEREANVIALISRYTCTDDMKAAQLEDKLDLVQDVFKIIGR
jgi:hypothetical protein